MHNRSWLSALGITIASILCLANSASANAYDCLPITPCEAYGKAQAVFIGQVIDGTKRRVSKNSDSEKVYVTGRIYFAIKEIFRGISGTVAELVEPHPDSAMSYAQGELYLIYAYEDEGELITSRCLRTKLIKDAKEDLDYLRNQRGTGLGGRLSGKTVMRSLPRSTERVLSGVKVTAINENQESFITTSDSNGYFVFTKLKQGKYRLVPTWPEHYVDSHEETIELNVFDGGCSQRELSARIDNSIKGSVFDSEGRPAPAQLSIVSISDKDLSSPSRADKYGQYNISSLPAGKYFLMIASSSLITKEPIYYPGVTDKSQAEIIEIGLGHNLVGFNFKLPESHRVRTFKGKVLYPDGRPAEGAVVTLRLQLGEQYPKPISYVTTGTDGDFTLAGFKGGVYEITVITFVDSEDGYTSIQEKRRFGRLTNLKLDKDIEGIEVIMKIPENVKTP
jgi:hypothetical protein